MKQRWERAVKIGIYGGTYNPPHLGHLAAARTAIDALKLDKLLLMPGGGAPHKALPENTPSRNTGWPWWKSWPTPWTCRRGGGVHPGAGAGGKELHLRGRWRSCARRYPKAELWLLMGTDMILDPPPVATTPRPSCGWPRSAPSAGPSRTGRRSLPPAEFLTGSTTPTW